MTNMGELHESRYVACGNVVEGAAFANEIQNREARDAVLV